MMRIELQRAGEVRVPVPAAVDACPGILALHPARDGHVARIRLPGGYVSRARWLALAALAGEFGDGCLDLTARGNVQLRGLQPGAGAALARRAARAGLLPSAQHDRSRNITASPLAGLGGRPPLRGIVRALDAAIVADPALAALPGRFMCAVDDGSGGAGLAASDIGVRRAGRQVETIIAGRLAGVRLPVADAVPAVVSAARAAVACGVGGPVTRIADLADGGASVAAAIGGSLGERVPASDARLPLGVHHGSNGAGLRLGPHGAGGGGVLVVAAPLGRLGGGQAVLIGGLLRAGEVLRLGIAGRVVIPLAQPPGAPLASLADAGLLTGDRDELAGVTACSGTACLKATADVRALARPLPGHPRTHWAACPRGCGRPPDAELLVAWGPDSVLVPGEPTPRRLTMLAGAP
jgi:precorrin-3B synthase